LQSLKWFKSKKTVKLKEIKVKIKYAEIKAEVSSINITGSPEILFTS
jgi:hypothetical protein